MKKIGVLLILVLIAACSPTTVNVTEEKDPEKLYNLGMKALKDEDYLEAGDAFGELRKRFSQSSFFALAELRAADVEYNQDNFAEAASLYDNFVQLFPTHPEAPY